MDIFFTKKPILQCEKESTRRYNDNDLTERFGQWAYLYRFLSLEVELIPETDEMRLSLAFESNLLRVELYVTFKTLSMGHGSGSRSSRIEI